MMEEQRRAEILNGDDDTVTALVREAVRRALEEHYRAGNPVSNRRNGQLVVVPPEAIPALLTDAYGEEHDTLARPAERDQVPPDPAPER